MDALSLVVNEDKVNESDFVEIDDYGPFHRLCLRKGTSAFFSQISGDCACVQAFKALGTTFLAICISVPLDLQSFPPADSTMNQAGFIDPFSAILFQALLEKLNESFKLLLVQLKDMGRLLFLWYNYFVLRIFRRLDFFTPIAFTEIFKLKNFWL